jgi:hypothetical protein
MEIITMADTAELLKLSESLPIFLATEGVEFQDINLNWYITNSSSSDQSAKFTVALPGNEPLPAGLILEENGNLCGTPEMGTAREVFYTLVFTATVPGSKPLVFATRLRITSQEQEDAEAEMEENLVDMINPRLEELKGYWEKLFDQAPLPDLGDILNDIKPTDIYYLLQRFATLTVWNADDLTPADKGQLMQIPDVSSFYNVYDFGVALVATPKDLYDDQRTLKHSVDTACAMMKEAHNRHWNVELAGFDRMVTAAWVTAQELGVKVYNYHPSADDMNTLNNVMAKKTYSAS